MAEPRPAVFFDLDRTLIEGSSISQLGVAAWRAGIVDLQHMGLELARGLLFGWLGESSSVADQTLPRILKTIEGKRRSELMELLEPLLDQLLDQVRPETKRLLGLHQQMGRDCYIVSASAVPLDLTLASRALATTASSRGASTATRRSTSTARRSSSGRVSSSAPTSATPSPGTG